MSYILGIDIGATKIAAGLVIGDEVFKSIKLPTQAHMGEKHFIANIFKVIKIFDNPKIKAIGIGIAGGVDAKKGILVASPNMPQKFKNIPLRQMVSKTFKKEVAIDNDAHCFALAESVYGAGKNYQYVIGVTIGTGVGGGIVINKKIYHGRSGLAGELGHMTIVENGLPCSCGNTGHLEVYASGTAMGTLYKRFTGKIKDAFYVEEQAYKGDKNALRVVKIMNETLGIGLANIINILNPDIIVIGGGLAHVTMIWHEAVKIAKKNVIYPALKDVKIVQSKLDKMAGILGAALLTQNI